jgi:dipeptidase
LKNTIFYDIYIVMKKAILLLTIILFLNISIFPGDDCFTIIVGKDASKTGAVMLAHNEDERGDFFVNVHKIPTATHPGTETIKLKNGAILRQAPKTFGFLWLQMPNAEFADSYFNSRGLVIASNSCPSREEEGELTNGGIGFSLRRILAERSSTALEAVILAGKLVETYGYYSSGRTLCIADPNEGWIMHIVKGKHWIAKRVPDNEVAVIANRYTMNQLDLDGETDILTSSGIVAYAMARGWADKKAGEYFNFAKTYSKPASYNSPANILRQWRGTNLLAEKRFKLDEPLPFSFEPKDKLEKGDLYKVLRDHYEGTEHDLSDNYKNGSPNNTDNRTICTDSTKYAFVAELRHELPLEIRHIAWISFMRPDANAFCPWYFSIQAPPPGYTRGDSASALTKHFLDRKEEHNPNYAFWTFAKLSQLVDQDYRERIRHIRKEWRNLENYINKNIKKKEKEFIYLSKRDKIVARKLITNYIHQLELRRWFMASEWVREFKK